MYSLILRSDMDKRKNSNVGLQKRFYHQSEKLDGMNITTNLSKLTFNIQTEFDLHKKVVFHKKPLSKSTFKCNTG